MQALKTDQLKRLIVFLMGLLQNQVQSLQNLNKNAPLGNANIYFQRSSQLGEPSELPLSFINELSSKTNFKLIVHGYLGSRNHGSILPLVNAYLAQGVDNVLAADWQEAANLDYFSSRAAVSQASLVFARILEEFLQKFEIDMSEVHLIGHSLGAHIVGGIGKYFNGTIGRITGLDPALPLFTPLSNDGLHRNDARFVDVIHTDFPIFGDITPRGTADFYPNFGTAPQRGCENVDLLSASKLIFEAYSCSHNRAVGLFAESIGMPTNFPTVQCSLDGIKLRNVSICLRRLKNGMDVNYQGTLAEAISGMDEREIIYMGESVSHSANGFYYLETYDTPPFGMGSNSKM